MPVFNPDAYKSTLDKYLERYYQAAGINPNWKPEPLEALQGPQAAPGGGIMSPVMAAKLGAKLAGNGSSVATPEVLNGTPVSMGATPLYVPLAAAATTALAGKAGLDMLEGKTPKGLAGNFGRASLGIATGGLSEIANVLGGFGRGYSNLEDTLRERLKEEQGINLTGENAWELNSKFKDTRNEGDLLGKDIVNAGAFYLADPRYSKASQDIKTQIADEALKRQLVREHNGGIEVNFGADGYKDFINNLLSKPVEAKPLPPGASQAFNIDSYNQKLQEYLAKMQGAYA